MTRDEILAMPAGPKMNRLVGEKVAGCYVRRRRVRSSVGVLYDLVIPDGVNAVDFVEPEAPWSACPAYSTDIAAAFAALRRLTGRKHWHYDLYSHDGTGAEEGSCWCRIRGPGVDVEAAGGRFDPRADDWEKSEEPLAICRAALLAVEGPA